MNLILSLLLLSGIIIESTIFPIPLTLIVFLAVANINIPRLPVWAFTAGIVLDLFSQRTVGSTSLLLLFLFWLIDRYRKKFDSAGVFFQFFTLVVSLLIYSYFYYRSLNMGKIIISVIIGIIVIIFVNRLFSENKNKVKLDL